MKFLSTSLSLRDEFVSRRRYLVAYDIRDETRLRRVHKAIKGFGYPLQYSVFICDLDSMEKCVMTWKVGEIINQRVDSVAILDLGECDRRGTECFEFLGKHLRLPNQEPRIL